MDQELPKGFIVRVGEDGKIVVTYKIFPGILKDLLFFAVAAVAGCLVLRTNLRFALLLFAFAAFALIMLWMGFRKLEFSPTDGSFTYRSGPVGGKVKIDEIATLDADQLGNNAGSFALIAADRDGKAHNLFRYLNETEAKALLEWAVQNIERYQAK